MVVIKCLLYCLGPRTMKFVYFCVGRSGCDGCSCLGFYTDLEELKLVSGMVVILKDESPI